MQLPLAWMVLCSVLFALWVRAELQLALRPAVAQRKRGSKAKAMPRADDSSCQVFLSAMEGMGIKAAQAKETWAAIDHSGTIEDQVLAGLRLQGR